VRPLLLDFDFTGSCERATDSNGYSIRIDGRDLGLNYLLRIIDRSDELVLVATPRDPRQPELIVGRTRGRDEGLLQIYLVEGWRFTKRAFEGRTLSHIYLTGDSAAIVPPADLVAAKDRSLRRESAEPPKPEVSGSPRKEPASQAKTEVSEGREYTFTRSEEAPAGVSPTAPVTGTSNRATPPAAVVPRTPSGEPLPPPPNPSNLPPLTPPVSTAPEASRIVPPPPPRNLRNRGSVSDTLTFNPPSPTTNSRPAGNRFKVMIDARTDGDRSRVRSLYPDAFRASYGGKSLWQIGVFTERDKAEAALQSVAPLPGSIVPF
jgi:hypothetical protein